MTKAKILETPQSLVQLLETTLVSEVRPTYWYHKQASMMPAAPLLFIEGLLRH